jgi:NADPH:quinone reductase-like Zn-dependent oxidoreductase
MLHEVLVHGAAGAIGSMVTQLAREAGGHIIGTGRAADRQKALDFGAHEFVDLAQRFQATIPMTIESMSKRNF